MRTNALLALAAVSAAALPARSATRPERTYTLYVCAESDDSVHKLRFGPNGIEELKKIGVGSFPADIEGPHGIGVSPDGKYWFVSIAHGLPFGSIHKYDTAEDEWLGDATVGMFAATLGISPSTGLLYVVNFNLHGDMVPSSISVVETSTMIEVARIPTGIMPHGVRLDAKGSRVYSANMMNDSVVEVDALRFEVARSLSLLDSGESAKGGHEGHGEQGTGGPGGEDGAGDPLLTRMSSQVKPTWATGPTKRGKIYVAGNGNHVIYEVDLEGWAVERKFEVGDGMGPYNLDVTRDGNLLVATYKAGAHVGFWDLQTGEEVARVKTTRTVPHGVVVSDDDRYAFVSIEGVGGDPGTVEVYELATKERVAKIDVGKQAGGIAIWKAEP